MRVILDLLHELTNTRMFGLFHNCMWQSRYSEVDVRCGRTGWLSNHNGSHRSNSICVYVFVCVFVFIWTFNRHIGTLAAKEETFVDFLCSVETGRPVLAIGFVVFGWVGWELSACQETSEPNFFIQLSLQEIFGGGRGDSYTFSYLISPVSILMAFGIQ